MIDFLSEIVQTKKKNKRSVEKRGSRLNGE